MLAGGLVAASVAAATLQGTINGAIPSRESVPLAPLDRGRDDTGTPAPSSWPTAMTVSPTADGEPRPSLRPEHPRPTRTVPRVPDGRFADLLRRFETSIRQGLSVGAIRPDVARDLGNVLADLRRDVDPDDPREVRHGVARLEEKVRTRTREGAITRHRADELLQILDSAP
ncbi:hypothetical protein Acsp03_67420 [Actinomadura sp. NBRC 104412]|nr:hypothetical protein Acsp03_67420 [Actinomadura sp. NBRC 104412]